MKREFTAETIFFGLESGYAFITRDNRRYIAPKVWVRYILADDRQNHSLVVRKHIFYFNVHNMLVPRQYYAWNYSNKKAFE